MQRFLSHETNTFLEVRGYFKLCEKNLQSERTTVIVNKKKKMDYTFEM